LSWSSKSVDFITLFTEDLERSKGFYHDVFGLRPIFEDDNSAVFRFANTGINVLRAEAAAGLVSPAAVADRNAGTRSYSRSAWTTSTRCARNWPLAEWNFSTAR
jgi:catechol 2,3-dioxygenase-like lactoylglutathione lyase family enzyme